MKHIIGLLAILLPLLSAAQPPAVRALNIGDTVPDITINNLINYKDSTAKLSDFKGKLVILDFWATWCGGCIKGFPILGSLQKEYADKMQVMLISNEGGKNITESENKVKAFFNTWRIKTEGFFSLPCTLEKNDSLAKLFPHIFIPHYVWIGAEGKVIAITSSTEVTAKNIEAVLNRVPVEMAMKVDSLKFHHQN